MYILYLTFSYLGQENPTRTPVLGNFDPERAVWNCWLLALFNDFIVYDVTTHATTLPATSPPLSMALNVFKTPKYFRYEKNNQLLVSNPEWQISVSGDTMSHSSLRYASTGICDIVSPLTEICHSGTDTSCRFYYYSDTGCPGAPTGLPTGDVFHFPYVHRNVRTLSMVHAQQTEITEGMGGKTGEYTQNTHCSTSQV